MTWYLIGYLWIIGALGLYIAIDTNRRDDRDPLILAHLIATILISVFWFLVFWMCLVAYCRRVMNDRRRTRERRTVPEDV